MLCGRRREIEAEVEVGDGRGYAVQVSLTSACNCRAVCSPSTALALLPSRLAFCAVYCTSIRLTGDACPQGTYQPAPSHAAVELRRVSNRRRREL